MAAPKIILEVGSTPLFLVSKNSCGYEIKRRKVINVTFPEQYHSEELAGKAVTFDVKINEIKRKAIRLDDEFAKDISEFETCRN